MYQPLIYFKVDGELNQLTF